MKKKKELKTYFSVKEVSNGYYINVRIDSEDYDYDNEEVYVFSGVNKKEDLVKFIENLLKA